MKFEVNKYDDSILQGMIWHTVKLC